jgi:preprotein translocase subunit SecG
MLVPLLYIVFVLAALVLIVVILLQEGRGGGFGQALGEHAQQTFGVGAQGIHKFTMGVALVFLTVAVVLTRIHLGDSGGSVLDVTVDQANPLTKDAPFGGGGAGGADDGG